MELKELYQEIILEHGKNPRNLNKMENFNKEAKGYNPLCGDKVHIFLKFNEKKKVEDISFEGSGCAISMASASIMTELIKGKEESDIKEIVNDFLDMIKEVKKDNISYGDLPNKYEAGTMATAQVVAFDQSIKFLEKIGMNNIIQHEKELMDYGQEVLRKNNAVKLVGNPKKKGAV